MKILYTVKELRAAVKLAKYIYVVPLGLGVDRWVKTTKAEILSVFAGYEGKSGFGLTEIGRLDGVELYIGTGTRSES